MSDLLKRMVVETLFKEIEPKLEEIEQERYFHQHYFDIKREKVFADADLCPDCKGKGGSDPSNHYGDSYWVQCCRCEGTGKYVKSDVYSYEKFFNRL